MIRTALPLSLLLIFALGPSATCADKTERNIPYGPDPLQRLDLTVPARQSFSTVVFIHGGSLTGGDKADEDYGAVCAAFVEAGVGCASINYRLAPKDTWPAQAEDVATAIAWVHSNIETRKGDPRRLFVFGHSSGAALAALVGADPRFLAQREMKPGDLAGVIPMGSIMWDVELEQAMVEHGRPRVEAAFRKDPDNAMFASLDAYLDHWPIRHVARGLPPYLFLIAEAEQEHPPVLSTNRTFVEESRRAGNEAEYRVLSGQTHKSAIRNLKASGNPALAVIRAFLSRSAAEHP